MTPTLVLIAGLPGSGKSTLARELAGRHGAVVLNPDEWMHTLRVDYADDAFRDRLEARLWALSRQLLSQGVSVVLDWGLWVREHREPKLRWAREHGVRVELHVLEVPLDERWRRVAARNAVAAPGTVPLTRELLASHERHFERPDAEERSQYDAPT